MRRALGVGVLVLALAGGAGAWLTLHDQEPTAQARTGPRAGPTPTPTPSPAASPTPQPAPTTRPGCPTTTAQPFAPRTITLTDRTLPVIAPPREAGGVPGTPPVSSAGKWEVAFDPEQGVRPGDPAGHVLLNAHTWPDGTALGNRLLSRLHEGDRIVVRSGTRRLCYRVDERVEVLASKGLPRYYATAGPPALALVVCSGRRLGPGNWEKRTVWFAVPRA